MADGTIVLELDMPSSPITIVLDMPNKVVIP